MIENPGFQIAVERIEEVARTGATELDLSGLGITNVPGNLFYNPENLNIFPQPDQPINLTSPSRLLRVLLCHAISDTQIAEDIKDRLNTKKWIEAKTEAVMPSTSPKWNRNINETLQQIDDAILCLSSHTLTNDRLPKEFGAILEKLDEKPEGSVFVIPLRLDQCEVPIRLASLEYKDYFPEDNQKWVLHQVLESLKFRARELLVIEYSSPQKYKPFSVFLCHVREDRKTVHEIYEFLKTEGWMDVWIHELDILPGADWQDEIKKAIDHSEIAMVFLSTNSISKKSYFAREVDLIITSAQNRPKGSIFLIPVRLDECEIPHDLIERQQLDYFKPNAHNKLMKSIHLRAMEVIPERLEKRNLKLESINLSSNKLKILSSEIGEVADLVKLNLKNNQLSDLPRGIKRLSALRELNIEDNQLDEFSIKDGNSANLTTLRLTGNPLNSLQISNIHILKSLLVEQTSVFNRLSELDLSGSQLTVVPPEIWQFTNLTSLNLSRGELINLPPEIGQLFNLTSLNLSNNKLINLPPEIGQLVSLTSLDLSNNKLISLPSEIGKLVNLEDLDISDNQLINLPPSLESLKALRILRLQGNSLNIPSEILAKWGEPQAILNYMSWVWDDTSKPLSETKMLVVGQGSVGKTSLIRRLTDNTFSSSETKTDGIAINHWLVPNNEVGEQQSAELRVNIWDFGGQEIMHATHQFFLTKRSLYLLVVDSRISQEENRIEYWLKIIQSFGGDSPVLIVGNKIDQHPLDIDRTGLRNKYPNLVGILEISAAVGTGLKELKAAIAVQVNALPHIRDIIPGTWFAVKTRLETLGRQQNYISQEKYSEICTEGEIRDETSQRTLIGFLHDLGIVLHFNDDPRLEALGILNPEWVTNGVYKILNAHALFQNKGVLERSMLADILPENDYPANKRLFIVDMMRKFELCYDIVPEQAFLVPDLLPKDEPYTGEWDGALAFQYHYNVLPSSIASRFIVRMNTFIHKTVWRSGVVLKKDGNTALVKADMEDRKIYIWVSGAENTRRDFLSVIRAEFDAIHKTIIKIEATEKVPVPEHPETEPIPFTMLLQAEREGRSTIPVMSDGRLIDVNVRELLNGLRVGEAPAPMMERVAPSAPVAVTEKMPEAVSAPAPQMSTPVKILRWVFVEFPKIVGRIPLDIVGKGKDAADSTLVSLGYGIIILLLLVVFGYVGFDALITMAKDIWRFFFPVKP